MKVNYKDNVNIIFRWMIDTIAEWWGGFNSKWVLSKDYVKRDKG